MTDYGTIKIGREEYERHNERRQEMGLSWGEYIDGQAPEPDIPAGLLEAMDATPEQLDRIEAAVKEATNAAQSAERAVEKLGGR